MPTRPLLTRYADDLQLFPDRWHKLGLLLAIPLALAFPFFASHQWLTIGNLAWVTVVGSLQPFAHGEEIDEHLYLTRSLAAVKADPSLYRDKCLRIDLLPGEIFDSDLDCLQLTLRRVGEEPASEETVSLGDFDLMKLFTQAFDQQQVPHPIRTLILDRYQDNRC